MLCSHALLLQHEMDVWLPNLGMENVEKSWKRSWKILEFKNLKEYEPCKLHL